jgi:hypothetical protein
MNYDFPVLNPQKILLVHTWCDRQSSVLSFRCSAGPSVPSTLTEVLSITKQWPWRTSIAYFSFYRRNSPRTQPQDAPQPAFFILTHCFTLIHIESEVPHTKCCDKGSNEPAWSRLFAWDRTLLTPEQFPPPRVLSISLCVLISISTITLEEAEGG